MNPRLEPMMTAESIGCQIVRQMFRNGTFPIDAPRHVKTVFQYHNREREQDEWGFKDTDGNRYVADTYAGGRVCWDILDNFDHDILIEWNVDEIVSIPTCDETLWLRKHEQGIIRAMREAAHADESARFLNRRTPRKWGRGLIAIYNGLALGVDVMERAIAGGKQQLAQDALNGIRKTLYAVAAHCIIAIVFLEKNLWQNQEGETE